MISNSNTIISRNNFVSDIITDSFIVVSCSWCSYFEDTYKYKYIMYIFYICSIPCYSVFNDNTFIIQTQ